MAYLICLMYRMENSLRFGFDMSSVSYYNGWKGINFDMSAPKPTIYMDDSLITEPRRASSLLPPTRNLASLPSFQILFMQPLPRLPASLLVRP